MHNLKEIVNVQGLFVLNVAYVDMNIYLTQTITKLLKEYILFIGYLYYLSGHCHSWRYNTDYLHAGIDILFYIMFYIINTMKKHETLLYHLLTYDTNKVPI